MLAGRQSAAPLWCMSRESPLRVVKESLVLKAWQVMTHLCDTSGACAGIYAEPPQTPSSMLMSSRCRHSSRNQGKEVQSDTVHFHCVWLPTNASDCFDKPRLMRLKSN